MVLPLDRAAGACQVNRHETGDLLARAMLDIDTLENFYVRGCPANHCVDDHHWRWLVRWQR